MAVKKITRFEVFKRDGFACQYCGKCPPAVILEVDHVVPALPGGPDSIDNLVTSCFDCNRGKGARSLTVLPLTVAKKIELARERELQVREYEKLLRLASRRKYAVTQRIVARFEAGLPLQDGKRLSITEHGRRSIAMFLDKLPETEINHAVDMALERIGGDGQQAYKYFCGVCWRKIKGDGP